MGRNWYGAQVTTLSEWTSFLLKRPFDSFNILNEIGSGSFGQVFLAEDLQSGKKLVAMKNIKPLKDEKGFPECAKSEISILGFSVNNKNIVAMTGFVIRGSKTIEELKLSYEGEVYIIMEYVEQCLKDVIEKEAMLGEDVCRSIMKQLLGGLKFIHGKGIVHRDIKPSNILVGPKPNYTVKLADFGSARKSATSMTGGVGTIAYSAPEILEGEVNYTEMIDMWSLGIIFGEMLTGRRLFDEATTKAQLKAIEVWSAKETVKRLETFDSCRPKACNLLNELLCVQAENRSSASAAFYSYFITEEPEVKPEVEPEVDESVKAKEEGEWKKKKRRRRR